MRPFNGACNIALLQQDRLNRLDKLTAVAPDVAACGIYGKEMKHRLAANCAAESAAATLSSQTTDQELVAQVKRGNKKAFDMLVLKYQHKVVKLISRYIYDHSEVQDIAQMTFLKAYRAIPGFRGDSTFYTWLYSIAVNTARNYFVHCSRRPPAFDIDVIDAEKNEADKCLKDFHTPEQLLLSDEVARTVLQAVSELSSDLQVAITLREIDGMSYNEIGVAMDCPVGTVRSRISRAREAIKIRLDNLHLRSL